MATAKKAKSAPKTERRPLISGVRIENFRSIVHAEVELGRLTVVIGANGSGKTNLLEAIAIVGAAAANKLDHEFLATRGVRPVERSFAISRFADEADPVFARVSAGAPLGLWEFTAGGGHQGELFATTGDVGPAATAWLRAVRETDGTPMSDFVSRVSALAAGSRPPGLATFLIYAPEYGALRKFEDEGRILPLGIRGEGLFRHLVELSRKSPEVVARIGEHLKVLDWFDGFVIPSDLGPGEKRLAIRDRYLAKDVQLDQRAANEGFLFLLFVYTLLLSPDTPRFFAIDNADAALNPLLCAKLVSDIAVLAKEQDRQVVLTTHNAGMLDGLDLADSEQHLLVCERDLDGHTNFRRIRSDKLSVNLSEAFLRGYLGGLPKYF